MSRLIQAERDLDEAQHALLAWTEAGKDDLHMQRIQDHCAQLARSLRWALRATVAAETLLRAYHQHFGGSISEGLGANRGNLGSETERWFEYVRPQP